MSGCGDIDGTNFVQQSDWEMIFFSSALRDCRPSLLHLKACKPNSREKILCEVANRSADRI